MKKTLYQYPNFFDYSKDWVLKLHSYHYNKGNDIMFADGGYGATENHSLNLLLESLPEDERKEIEKELREEDEQAYLEFKEWQKDYNSDD